MKKFLHVFPLVLCPYISLICAITFFILAASLDVDNLLLVLSLVAVFFHIVPLICCVKVIVNSISGKYNARHYASMGLIIKISHIPSNIGYSILLFLGLCMSVWGIPFIIISFLALACSMALSGTFQISSCISANKDKTIGPLATIVCFICNYILFFDLISAIFLYIRAKKHQ